MKAVVKINVNIVSALLLIFLADIANASYINRYSENQNGAITFTGNTIGLSKGNDVDAPGTSHAIGTFISLNNASQDNANWPFNTTGNISANGSAAVLNIPAGSTIEYAELIWGGSIYDYDELFNSVDGDISSSLNNSVTFNTPSGSFSISPDPATAQSNLAFFSIGGILRDFYYVRSANVTTMVQAALGGNYSVEDIPATQYIFNNTANAGGWTLAVVYSNPSLPQRNLSLFVSAEAGGDPATSVSGFCTPVSGPTSGRVLVTAMEGDSSITGDEFRFGPTSVLTTANRLSGSNNLATNCFASQINNDSGALDTSGTFGTSNHPLGSNSSGRRQGWDITNVDASSQIVNGQTQAFAQGLTSGDQYVVAGLGIQIDLGQPAFPTNVKVVDKTDTFLGDILTYTVTLDNGTGTADATNVEFQDTLPSGLTFVSNSVIVDGISQPTFNPETGFNVGTIAIGDSLSVVFQAEVTSIPASPATAEFANSASWDYDFQPCVGQPTLNNSVSTNLVTSGAPRISLDKTVDILSEADFGDTLTYTILVTNDGASDSVATQLEDLILSGTTYVANSTSLNAVSVADNAGDMPYISFSNINSVSGSSGVIVSGESATITFQVTINNGQAQPVTNTANLDPDSRDSVANLSDNAVTKVKTPSADITVTKTDSSANYTPGGTGSYVITVTNNGPSNVAGIVITDELPNGVTLSSAWTCTDDANSTCPVASGGSAGDSLISVTVDINDGGIITLTIPVAYSIDPLDYQ